MSPSGFSLVLGFSSASAEVAVSFAALSPRSSMKASPYAVHVTANTINATTATMGAATASRPGPSDPAAASRTDA